MCPSPRPGLCTPNRRAMVTLNGSRPADREVQARMMFGQTGAPLQMNARPRPVNPGGSRRLSH